MEKRDVRKRSKEKKKERCEKVIYACIPERVRKRGGKRCKKEI